MVTRRPCDCTVHCGDDPDLHTGQVAVCARKQRLDRERAEAAERMYLQQALAFEAAMHCIRAAPQQLLDGVPYFVVPVAPGQPPVDLRRAARYLVLCNRAAFHPDRPALLSLVDPTPQRRSSASGITTGASTR